MNKNILPVVCFFVLAASLGTSISCAQERSALSLTGESKGDAILITAKAAAAEAEAALKVNPSQTVLIQVANLKDIRQKILRAQASLRKEIERRRTLSYAYRDEARSNDIRSQQASGTLVGNTRTPPDLLSEEELKAEIEKTTKTLDELEKARLSKPSAPISDPGSSLSLRPYPSVDEFKASTSLNALKQLEQYRKLAKENRAAVQDNEALLHVYETVSTELDYVLQRIDDKLHLLFEESQQQSLFTLLSTAVFGILIGCVIGAFFYIAFKSETVRNAIFTGDNGIQFITIFSLVIAIILFGVLRILEGKELSALLGGLSGYILGRGGLTRGQVASAGAQQGGGGGAHQQGAASN